jgi:hypothetical protein
MTSQTRTSPATSAMMRATPTLRKRRILVQASALRASLRRSYSRRGPMLSSSAALFARTPSVSFISIA